MQDSASRHAEMLGVGHAALEKHDLTFMLSRLAIRLHNAAPQGGEAFTLETWPRSVERLLTTRDFIGRNNRGEVFLQASTSWLIVNTQKMKIVRPGGLLEHLELHRAAAMERGLPEPTWLEEALYSDERHVRFSDLDINQHVNNTRYTDWICDALAVSVGTQFRVLELAVSFISQLRHGESVKISVASLDDDSFVVQGKTERKIFAARARVAKMR